MLVTNEYENEPELFNVQFCTNCTGLNETAEFGCEMSIKS